ncbi:hypothetical protein HG535_0A05280 [Zygotorulaspora mrakii]|uniref:Sfi1 spindle body domain-containing protein n=1 Tax=Zygotorulaspora mrakii TaxID=42260 RepID=A0A7H9AWR8_ZYGMR|nr:uncharacterized protein HG535_0A05280 [Zygotorulaspora mrakii]QLG70587.1 hypothetical protein HG535_0A05280 [Zygotorulaspora mrakii]
MAGDGSKEFLLKNFELSDGTDSSVSTQLLINENVVSDSTDSLVNERIQELLDRVHITEYLPVNSDLSENTQEPFSFLPKRLHHEEAEAALNAEEFQGYRYTNNNVVKRKDLSMNQEYYPILAILYNRIQVFLLNNKMSLDFLKIFKSYMNHIIESGLNVLEDRYFLELQNELSDGFHFGPVMEEILNKFLLRPENLIMKLALFEHKMMLGNLQRFFSAWQLKCDMKLSLVKLENVWKQYIQRKYTAIWSRKYQYLESNLVTQANEFRVFTSLSSGFDKWMGKLDTNHAKDGLADHFFLDHIFRKIKKYVKTMNFMETEANGKYVRERQRYALRFMRLRFAETQFTCYKNDLKRILLRKLQSKLDHYKLLKARAEFTDSIFVLSSYLKKWYEKTESSIAHSNHLASLETRFRNKRTLNTLKDILNRNNQELQLMARLDRLLLEYTFKNIWQKRFQEHISMYSFWNKQNQQIVTLFLDAWRERLYFNSQAYQFRRKQQLLNAMLAWRIASKVKSHMYRNDRRRLAITFEQWLVKARLRKKHAHFLHGIIARMMFLRWKSTYLKKCDALSFSTHHYDECCLRRQMSKWVGKLGVLDEINERLLIYEKFCALETMRHGIKHGEEVNEISRQFNPVEISKGNLIRYLVLWKEMAISKKIKNLQDMLDDYQFENNNIVQHSYLQVWFKRMVFYQSECFQKSELKYGRSLKKRLFATIKAKEANIARLLQISDDLRRKSLMLNMIFSWEAHLGSLRGLHKKSEREINKRNLSLLLSYLKVWSMQILKSRRNDETVQIFRKRWDRAAVRGILLLWKNRTEHSPKKLRWKKSGKVVDALQFAPSSNLVTPVRNTSSNNNTIPGSEGVKKYRLEAMKSHYSKVRRAIPSPVKSSTTLDSIAKKKFSRENENTHWVAQPLPPPRISIERINKNLASKIDNINFERIPEVKLDPFVEQNDEKDPVLDRSLLELDEDISFDDSPTRRT